MVRRSRQDVKQRQEDGRRNPPARQRHHPIPGAAALQRQLRPDGDLRRLLREDRRAYRDLALVSFNIEAFHKGEGTTKSKKVRQSFGSADRHPENPVSQAARKLTHGLHGEHRAPATVPGAFLRHAAQGSPARSREQSQTSGTGSTG